MKKISLLLLIFLYAVNLLAQKPNISDTTYLSWGNVRDGKLSNRGNFAFYNIKLGLGKPYTSIICSTDRKWEAQFQSLSSEVFSANEKYLYGILNNQLIQILLGTTKIDTIAAVRKYNLILRNNNEYLVCLLRDQGLLYVMDTQSGKINSIPNIEEYWTNEISGVLVLKQAVLGNTLEKLMLHDLAGGKNTELFTGSEIVDLIFDDRGSSVAFIARDGDSKSIWYSNFKKQLVTTKLVKEADLKNKSITTQPFWQFSNTGDQLYFGVDEKQPPYKERAADPDVWSYQDKVMYPYFKSINFKFFDKVHLINIDIFNSRLTQLTQSDEIVVSKVEGKIQSPMVIQTVDSSDWDRRADEDVHRTYYVLDKDGHRTILKQRILSVLQHVTVSPDRKYIIYFDLAENSWESYHIESGTTTTFAQSIMQDVNPYQVNMRKKRLAAYGIAAWIKGTDNVIIQGDRYLWLVNIKNSANAIQLTRSKSDSTEVFYFCEKPKGAIINPYVDHYIHSVDQTTAITSLYRLNINKGQFVKVYSDDIHWNDARNTIPRQSFQLAEKSTAFLFIRGNVSKSPNYFFTRNFKTVTHLSDFYPEKQYNWIRSELHTYKDSLGNICRGILYKPDNFDSTKKYPIIFSIYQEQSQESNVYIAPDPVSANLNIPLMVSNGYLVFKPDVYIKTGESGRYMVLSVIAAADYLSKFDWINGSKIGLIGHSLGGGEVNYIITKTNRFVAAVAGAGTSNIANNYNDLWGGGDEKQRHVVGMYGMSGPLEKAVPEYVKMSAIFNAKEIQTPLLLFHNNKDPNVDFYNSSQFFVQLRSIGKKVWLLSYEGEGHGVFNKTNQLDYQQKVTSFFDFHLRDQPMPNWMKKHISY